MSFEQLQFRGYAVKDTAKFTEFELIDFECVPTVLVGRARR